MTGWATLGTVLCAGTVLLGQSTGAGAERPRQGFDGGTDVPVTITGCLYEVSDEKAPGTIDGTSREQTTRYVLTEVKMETASGERPGAGADRPGRAVRGEGQGKPPQPAGTSGARAEGATLETPERVRVLFANDREARTLTAKRVEISGRLDDDAAHVGTTGTRGNSSRGSATSPDERDAPIPHLHADRMRDVPGTCPASPGV